MKRAPLVFGRLLCCATSFAQSLSKTDDTKTFHAPKACDEAMNFCWYPEEVVVLGQGWNPTDAAEKPIVKPTQIRCLKQLGVCIKARADKVFGETLVGIDVLPITRWDSDQILADGEGNSTDPCERETYVFSRVDHSVTLVDAPGKNANDEACQGILGKPRTITYKLTH